MDTNCYYCGKTVYGANYLSGGMCYTCSKKHEEKVREAKEYHKQQDLKRALAKKENEKSD